MPVPLRRVLMMFLIEKVFIMEILKAEHICIACHDIFFHAAKGRHHRRRRSHNISTSPRRNPIVRPRREPEQG